METIYFFVGAVTVAVVFAIVWLLRVVSSQIKQIQDLERGLESVVSNDITESDVRAIVDSRVDKYASNVEREFEKTTNYVDSLNNNQYDNLNEVHRRIDDVVRELKNEININRVTNTRRVTNSDLQSEY
jgi:gas vesicle protein